MNQHHDDATIEADPTVPIIRVTRDFAATQAQLFRAHTDPEIFTRWVGPDGMTTTVDRWDATSGGSWRYVAARDGEEYGFHGCFHDVRPDRIVQTFTWEGDPDGVALETLDFEDLGNGRTRLRTQSLCDSFEGRDAWLRSGMEGGVNEGHAKLDDLLAAGEIPGGTTGAIPTDPAERHCVIAAGFSTRVLGAGDWDAQAPVPGWRARDVVAHLVEWFPEFLKSATGLDLDRGPAPEENPVAAWQTHSDAVQRLLDGPDADTPFRHPMVGEMPLPEAVDRFYTTDVFLHTWDLARATGQDEHLDEQTCADLLTGMTPIEDVLRSSGQYGPRVPVPDDADVQTRLLAFIGRDPLRSQATRA